MPASEKRHVSHSQGAHSMAIRTKTLADLTTAKHLSPCQIDRQQTQAQAPKDGLWKDHVLRASRQQQLSHQAVAYDKEHEPDETMVNSLNAKWREQKVSRGSRLEELWLAVSTREQGGAYLQCVCCNGAEDQALN